MKNNLNRTVDTKNALAVACGAMIAGLLVLPAYAYVMTGPSVYFAFLLAGLLFVPGVLSAAEMATVLPESGGDFQFIDRALGPAASTISGLGMYLALLLKTSFALVGVMAYFNFVVPGAGQYSTLGGILLVVFLVTINALGVKKAAALQFGIMVVVIISLSIMGGYGSSIVQSNLFSSFFNNGVNGFITATAFAFISYAGVIKVVSIGGEIKNPHTTIPLVLIVAIVGMTLLYTIIVYVIVGSIPSTTLTAKEYINAPFASFGQVHFGWYGQAAASILSGIALVAMANAGVLASSRYPYAMANRKQAPTFFTTTNHAEIPYISLIVTGGLIAGAILALPVVSIAKLASGFQIILLVLLNGSVIAFRECDNEWYTPTFYTPGYPYMQIVGIVGSLFVLFYLGTTPLLVVGGIVVLGLLWYYFYVIPRTKRSGTLAKYFGFDVKRNPNIVPPGGVPNQKKPISIPVFLPNEDELELERRLEVGSHLCKDEQPLDVPVFAETPDTDSQALSNSATNRIVERIRQKEKQLDRTISIPVISTISAHDDAVHYMCKETVEAALVKASDSYSAFSKQPWFEQIKLPTYCYKDQERSRIETAHCYIPSHYGEDKMRSFIERIRGISRPTVLYTPDHYMSNEEIVEKYASQLSNTTVKAGGWDSIITAFDPDCDLLIYLKDVHNKAPDNIQNYSTLYLQQSKNEYDKINGLADKVARTVPRPPLFFR